MVNNSPTLGSAGSAEHREEAPVGWSQAQDEMAANAGMSVLLVEGHQPPSLVVSNNNSICAALQSSAEHAKLCDPYCGDAHRKAQLAGTTIEYKCHAGLQCFAAPVVIGNKRDLVVIGGRAFVTSADYRTLIERFRTGDLKRLTSEALFENIIFAEPQRLAELAESVRKISRRVTPITEVKSAETKTVNAKTARANSALKEADPVDRRGETLESEVERLRNELEYRDRFTDSLQRFLERISSKDPGQTYNSIINNSKDLLGSERVSLLMFDESANELIFKAGIGLPVELAEIGHIRIGEGVAGEVIESGKALIVANVDLSGVKPAPLDRRYKTKSFISYPIAIGGRKIGVLNVTDRSTGGPYNEVDLGVLEIIGPQVALALERAEWQERATEFQLMSITDPLTTLPNRRYLEERLTEELNRSKRYDYPMSFLMIDIDDFKAYNDNNGHQAGDLALQITAHCLKAALRSADIASRYGGEEFCILLPQTSMVEAGVIADRIRQRVATTHFPHGKSQPLGRVSLSIGVSTYSKVINSAEIVIAAADRALYKAKRLGKDRIEFYQEDAGDTQNSR
jgi:diguanylate cyclase (GGDEF)-like protein